MITFHFNSEINILEVSYQGKISMEELFEYGRKIRNNKTYPRDLKIFTDATKADYAIKEKDIHTLLRSIEKDVNDYYKVKSAMLHSSPKETAISMILEFEEKIPKYSHRIFSTREAALQWLIED